MDYRKRKYYYYAIDSWSRDMRFEYFKIAAPSIKFHFNNYLSKHRLFRSYNSCMISCKKEESEDLEYELKKSVCNDDYAKYIEITKDTFKQ